MILQALVQHYENLAAKGKVSREGWCQAKVSYGINLAEDGRVMGIVSLKQKEIKGKKEFMVPQPLRVPEMVTRSSGVAANFLCDNSKYLLGIDVEGTNSRVLDCFQAAKKRHLKLLAGVEGRMSQSVRLFFEYWEPERAMECEAIRDSWEEITEGGNLIFCMGMKYAQDDPAIQKAWEQDSVNSAEGPEGVCLVTGERTQICRIHRTIKGIPGAQASGAALVSFNAPAFESYGKEQSFNAPVGRYAQFAYTTALNDLLSHREYTFQLGDSMVVFWAESGEEECQEAFFMSVEAKPDNQETIRDIFEDLRNHRPIRIHGIDLNPDQKFYILALAPNAAGLSVRFFYENSFGAILENLFRHYQRMQMIKPAWETREYLGIRDLLLETVNQKSKDKSPIPNMAALVLQAILSGSCYPASLYTDTLIRIRAEQGRMTWGRAGILKAYLIQNYHWKEGEGYMGLYEDSMEAAYVLGRIFAVLEAVQQEANPGLNTTIRDRYFNSACAAPASVFPVLIRLKNSHMKKLERDKAGAKVYYERLLTELMGRLKYFPNRLTLEEQGQFDLGYYHQMQKRYEKREEQ